jgi:hypothetical protein
MCSGQNLRASRAAPRPTIKTMCRYGGFGFCARRGAGALEQVAVATDHSFSDRRIELQSIVIKSLETLKK